MARARSALSYAMTLAEFLLFSGKPADRIRQRH